MQAITLWQPYATLIAVGAKKYETRSWATRYRGDLVIHAAAKRDHEIMDLLRLVRSDIARFGVHLPPLTYGAALCIVRLADCIPATFVPEEEQRFGDFGYGRYAWLLTDVRVFEKPIPVRGKQGFWEWEAQ